MVGQDNIINRLKSIPINEFPRSILLLGELGSGKHTLTQVISKILGLDIIDISNDFSSEIIDNIYQRVEPHIYLIDISKQQASAQMKLLKFIEEPLKNSYTVLISDNKLNVIETLINRCYNIELKYSIEALRLFTDGNANGDLVIRYSTTPGQVIDLLNDSSKFNTLCDCIALADNIILNIHRATLPNTLSISNKMAFNKEKGKLDVDLFMRVMSGRLLEKIIRTEEEGTLLRDIYSYTRDCRYKMILPNVSAKYIFEKWLCDLWKITRKEN